MNVTNYALVYDCDSPGQGWGFAWLPADLFRFRCARSPQSLAERTQRRSTNDAEENGGKHGGGFIFIQAPRFLGRLSLGFFELSMREYPLFFLSLNNRMLSGGGQQVSCNFVRKK